jgi:simple sugar transport system ATP-binding protein
MKNYQRAPVSKGWALNLDTIKAQARQLIEDFDISAPSVETAARTLSGGNLQKLILAREFSDEPNVIVAVYPSRGLDVGATENVHSLLIRERDRGAAVLLISEDLDELLSLSDRILVLYEGQIMGEVPPDDDRVEEIGLMMAGTKMETELAG